MVALMDHLPLDNPASMWLEVQVHGDRSVFVPDLDEVPQCFVVFLKTTLSIVADHALDLPAPDCQNGSAFFDQKINRLGEGVKMGEVTLGPLADQEVAAGIKRKAQEDTAGSRQVGENDVFHPHLPLFPGCIPCDGYFFGISVLSGAGQDAGKQDEEQGNLEHDASMGMSIRKEGRAWWPARGPNGYSDLSQKEQRFPVLFC